MTTSSNSVTSASSSTSEPTLPKADSVDVLLLLEGTFPYVAGGVSSWVNQIIRGYPELRFGAIFIGSQPADYGAMRYALPENLVHLDVVYLAENKPTSKIRPTKVKADPKMMAQVKRMHELFQSDIRHPDCPHLFSSTMDEAHAGGKLMQCNPRP